MRSAIRYLKREAGRASRYTFQLGIISLFTHNSLDSALILGKLLPCGSTTHALRVNIAGMVCRFGISTKCSPMTMLLSGG